MIAQSLIVPGYGRSHTASVLTGKRMSMPGPKTLVGLCTRVIAKMASHVLKYVLNIQFGIKVQTFEMAPSAA